MKAAVSDSDGNNDGNNDSDNGNDSLWLGTGPHR
jgi:hypothetical protein